ncbi:MAG: Tyrosine-tRNA ligase, partial [Candidatus Gottesmanbacteria bacterium GW2011_GWA1_43_11]
MCLRCSKNMKSASKILENNVAEILPDKEGLKRLMDSKKIRVYLGIDPTGSKLHLGHT